MISVIHRRGEHPPRHLVDLADGAGCERGTERLDERLHVAGPNAAKGVVPRCGKTCSPAARCAERADEVLGLTKASPGGVLDR